MASDDEHMGVFLELKGAGSRNMEYVLQAQNRDWYSFLNRCLDCGGVIRRFDLAINDMCGLLDIPVHNDKCPKTGGVGLHKRYNQQIIPAEPTCSGRCRFGQNGCGGLGLLHGCQKRISDRIYGAD